MPHAEIGALSLYYEVHGEGPSLVLVEGLNFHTWMWFRQVPELSRRFRVLTYDNRGVGLSDKPPGPYTVEQNARDLAGLLDYLGWERAHVLGHSMGGFIAQELALLYPERLDKLVLVSTGFGGPNTVPIPEEAQRVFTPDPSLSYEAQVRRAMPVDFGDPSWPESHQEEYEQMIRWRVDLPQPLEAVDAQLAAVLGFNVENRIAEIRAPTLIIAGTNDSVIPVENSRLLAAALLNARLDLIPGAGHLVFIEEAGRFNRDVTAFLER